ncbi:unnamed protein product [Kuraishia capsulata CBS 1993]|uniref:Uncharacterized protein n=1 Tax=Kuraishia capsulata CBS 1993 TaxID=1382522 RepID=W6MK44_9ASCO|nr:uncharacterized protein KUCA_T00000924001 [Kuraishia capsulata CBS 1993]CDK24957.1 unnamed protein product [Kuraishia capsulata CBS 1993]
MISTKHRLSASSERSSNRRRSSNGDTLRRGSESSAGTKKVCLEGDIVRGNGSYMERAGSDVGPISRTRGVSGDLQGQGEAARSNRSLSESPVSGKPRKSFTKTAGEMEKKSMLLLKNEFDGVEDSEVFSDESPTDAGGSDSENGLSPSEQLRQFLESKLPLSPEQCDLAFYLAESSGDQAILSALKKKIEIDFRNLSLGFANARVSRIDELIKVIDQSIAEVQTNYNAYKKHVELKSPKPDRELAIEKSRAKGSAVEDKSQPLPPPIEDVPVFRKTFQKAQEPLKKLITASRVEYDYKLKLIEMDTEQRRVIWQQYWKEIADAREKMIDEISSTQAEMRNEFVGLNKSSLENLDEKNYRKSLKVVGNVSNETEVSTIRAQVAARVARSRNVGIYDRVRYGEIEKSSDVFADRSSREDLELINDLREGFSQADGPVPPPPSRLMDLIEASTHDPSVSPLAGFSDFVHEITKAQQEQIQQVQPMVYSPADLPNAVPVHPMIQVPAIQPLYVSDGLMYASLVAPQIASPHPALYPVGMLPKNDWEKGQYMNTFSVYDESTHTSNDINAV